MSSSTKVSPVMAGNMTSIKDPWSRRQSKDGGPPRSARREKAASVRTTGAVQLAEREEYEESSIPHYISMRVCKQFVYKSEKKDECALPEKPTDDTSKPALKRQTTFIAPIDPLCHCGYPHSAHSPQALANQDDNTRNWFVHQHTEAISTNAFGDLEFVGHGQKLSKFVRIDHLSDENSILQLMLDEWKLGKPNLLISVTGGAKNFHMRPRLKEVFRRGLIKAATSTGAWIITGGMAAGVMKHVGKAVEESVTALGHMANVVAIGITPWGAVNNKECMVNTKGLRPAQYRIMPTPPKTRQSPIDQNHSHFIFVDNGTQHKFGTEIAFRAKLERAISLMKTDNEVPVPVVCVVLEGGPGTLETVKSAIQNGTPAVIVEGSGRAADILAYAYANSSEEEIEVTDHLGIAHKKTVAIVDDEVWEEVKCRIQANWKNQALEQRINWVKECLEHRDYMTIFRLDGSSSVKSIDVAILQALLKVNRNKSLDQLRLALAWNRIDVAKMDIFTEDKKWSSDDLDESMYSALMNDRVDFLRLFLDNGLILKDFLTVKCLLNLYNNIPHNTFLYQLLRKERKKKERFITLEDVGELIQTLMGDFFQPLYIRGDRYTGLDVERISCNPEAYQAALRVTVSSQVEADGVKTSEEMVCQKGNMADYIKGVSPHKYVDPDGVEFTLPHFDVPARELFIWAVLLNRLDMAMVFWNEGMEQIAAALVAQKLLKSMLSRTEDSELQKSLCASLEHFDKVAVGVLAECYASDERRARLLLVRELPNFGNSTIMQLAVKADNKTFIAHSACQALLNSIWIGRMSSEVTMIKMWLCVLIPFLIFPLIHFREDDRLQLAADGKKKVEDKNSKKTNGNMELKKLHNSFSSKQILLADQDEINNESSTDPEPQKRYHVSWWRRITYFYNAPVVTFIHNCLSYLIFLGFYSYVLLHHFHADPSWHEYFLIIWVFTLFTEEVRQVFVDDSTTLVKKFSSYITDVWNIMDVITIVTFMLGVILRFIDTSSCESCHPAARVVLAINLMSFCFRMLHIFSIHKELGPKLVMIRKMMVDLAYFVLILMVFIVAFGLASHAILYPNSDLDWRLVQHIFHRPYYQMYGELFLEDIQGKNPCSNDPLLYNNGTEDRCPSEYGSWVVPILLGFYILITNVLMLNLLIAMFSNTFEAVQKNADSVWKSIHFTLVREYYERPPIAPPFIIIAHVVLLVRYALRSYHLRQDPDDHFKVKLTDGETKQLVGWENMNADEYIRQAELDDQCGMENVVKTSHEKVESLAHRLEEIAESSLMLQAASSSSEKQASKLPPALDERINYLEEQMKRTSRALDWIISSMIEKGQGSKQGAPVLADIDSIRDEALRRRQAEADSKKQQYEAIFLKQLELHTQARSSHYPCTYQVILRYNVPNSRVNWEDEFEEYEPVRHTDRMVLAKPEWADVDLLDYEPANRPVLPFNDMDSTYNINRVSHLGTYQVTDSIPVNPRGRTGIYGRGRLGRWGPNHAGDPIVTRWSKTPDGEFVMDGGKKVLEFVAVYRKEAKQWAIPGSLMNAGEKVHECLKFDFSAEALASLDQTQADPSKKLFRRKLDELFSQGEEVFRGYSDDPRNTDNAWVETIAINYHDEDGTITQPFELQAGEMVELVRWMKVGSHQSLYGSHLAILHKVCKKHKAAF